MLGRLWRMGPFSSNGGSGTAASSSAPSMLMGRFREPVLPVLTRAVKSASGGAGSGGKQHHNPWEGAAFLVVLLLLLTTLAACTVAAAVSGYAFSIIFEPSGALSAAAAEVQAAAGVGRAAVGQVQQLGGSLGAGLSAASNGTEDSRYTVVVMSYSRRLSILPLVINKLGSCPSVAEVLLVWNGDNPPKPYLFDCPAPVRIRQEDQTDLSNRMRPDPSIKTEAVFLADDDVLLRCADLERAFARWQSNRQALVGFFPRLAIPGPPPQYFHEFVVFRRQQYNTLLTGGEFASRSLLELYWTPWYTRGRELVHQLTNCEDLLLNFVAAAATQERQQLGEQQQGEQQGRRLPHVVWVQPSRRLDISSLSGVGISRERAAHEATRRQCVSQLGEWYGEDLLQTEEIAWRHNDSSAKWRLLRRPLCSLPFLGCVYL